MACASAPFHLAPPAATHAEARPAGYGPIRFWGDAQPDNIEILFERRAVELNRRFADRIAAGKPITLNYLALSGGGADGAFGAGLMNGWTKSGTRPEFEHVTGISTGALIAPFAFLGPEWDDALKQAYTNMTTDGILSLNILRGLIGGLALADSSPFRQTIKNFATEDMFQQIAAEHKQGRRLYIGTTALDAARPVVWDIGAIANSGKPGALDLFHDIILASASIPGAFPPVLIDVEVEGKQYSELHVDGGVTAQVFAYPTEIDIKDFDKLVPTSFDRTMYVIRNATLIPPYENVKARLLPLALRSMAVLISYQGIGDLYRISADARRDGIEFRLKSIPGDWDRKAEEPFDQEYMTELFAVGEQMGRDITSWRNTPFPTEPEAKIAVAN